MDFKWISFFLFGVAGLIHIGFFVFESIYLKRISGQTFLGLDDKTYKQVKIWAFNQGFYNLAIGLGTFSGLYYVRSLEIKVAGVLISFCGLTMIMAGLVLFFSVPKMRKMALAQLLPPLLGFVFLFFHIAKYV